MLIPSVVTKEAGLMARAARWPKGLSPLHGLRHYNATLMMAGNTPLKVASARLGHSSTRITADFYQHPGETLDRRAADAIDAAFGPLLNRSFGGLIADAGISIPGGTPIKSLK
jgi:integrase